MLRTLVLAAVLAACSSDGDDGGTGSGSGVPLDEAAAFGFDNFPSQADCDAAKMSGQIPPMATCQNQLLFCPDGVVHQYTGDVIELGTYSTTHGDFEQIFSLTFSFGTMTGPLGGDGTLYLTQTGFTTGTSWKTIPVASVTQTSCN